VCLRDDTPPLPHTHTDTSAHIHTTRKYTHHAPLAASSSGSYTS
jgi:hypothetical protein